jgi:hypothetical protein
MNYENPYPSPPSPQPENTGKEIWKVMRLHLGIFAGYQLGLAFLCEISGIKGYMEFDMIALIMQWIALLVLMVISFSAGKKAAGLGYLISLLFCVVVGFGSCWKIGGYLH